MTNEAKIVVAQLGPIGEDKDANVQVVLDVLDSVRDSHPDFVLFPELATTPFFAIGLKNQAYFDLAETVPGPTTKIVGAKAKELGCHVILPLFERGQLEGQYYNSAVVIGPDGEIIPGVLPDGRKVLTYRKNYISDFNWGEGLENDEKFYFGVGPGYPVFDTEKGRIGILICYDRWFPEGYKILALQGAQIVFVPVASTGFVGDLFVAGLRTHAAENAFAVIGCNKSGDENVGARTAHYYGLSCIVGIRGEVLAAAPQDIPATIEATIDLDAIKAARRRLFVLRDRRPELYGLIAQ
ncbi:MAG TPA: carbon-nitrogen hydrolase family protein [Candidatus Dormibacteraeota bacterium]